MPNLSTVLEIQSDPDYLAIFQVAVQKRAVSIHRKPDSTDLENEWARRVFINVTASKVPQYASLVLGIAAHDDEVMKLVLDGQRLPTDQEVRQIADPIIDRLIADSI